MSSYNRVILMGHMTRDPQLKFLPSQTPVCEFGIAMNRKWSDKGTGEEKEEVCFVDCAAFGKTAEVINEHFAKGRAIHVEGRLKFDSWEDKNGGGKRSKLTVVVDNFQFVGSKSDGEGGSSAGAFGGRTAGGQQGQSRERPPPQRQQQAPQQQPQRQQERPTGQAPQQKAQRPAETQPPAQEEPFYNEADIPF